MKIITQHKTNIITITAVVIILAIYYAILPSPLFNDPVCTVIEDKNHELLGAHIAEDGQWRFPECKEVSDKFIKAITCFEDRRFFYHQGFDPIAIIRAIKSNLSSGKKRITSAASCPRKR